MRVLEATPAGAILPAILKPLTRAQGKLLDAGAEIAQSPDAIELAYLARELVQCTLPHSNPGRSADSGAIGPLIPVGSGPRFRWEVVQGSGGKWSSFSM
jgi:hypothetical protein